MPMGPGKYDPYVTDIREKTGAYGVVLIVLGGEHGNGFSVQADGDTTLRLPELLEQMAADIRASFDQGRV